MAVVVVAVFEQESGLSGVSMARIQLTPKRPNQVRKDCLGLSHSLRQEEVRRGAITASQFSWNGL